MITMKRMAAGAAGLALAAGLTLTAAAPAQALGRCNFAPNLTNKSAQVQCTEGGGSPYVRAAVGCTKWYTGGYAWTRYGPWVGQDGISVARCGALEGLKYSWFEFG